MAVHSQKKKREKKLNNISIGGIVGQKPSCSGLNSDWKMRKWKQWIQTSHSRNFNNKGRRKMDLLIAQQGSFKLSCISGVPER